MTFAARVVSKSLCAFRKQWGKFLGIIIISSELESFFTAEVTVWFGSHPQNKSVWWDFDNTDGTEMTVHLTWSQVEVESQSCLDCGFSTREKGQCWCCGLNTRYPCCFASCCFLPWPLSRGTGYSVLPIFSPKRSAIFTLPCFLSSSVAVCSCLCLYSNKIYLLEGGMWRKEEEV